MLTPFIKKNFTSTVLSELLFYSLWIAIKYLHQLWIRDYFFFPDEEALEMPKLSGHLQWKLITRVCQEQHFGRDAFKFFLIPKNRTGATRGQTDQFWLKKVEEQPSHWKKVKLLFLMLNPLKAFSFPPFKSNIFPLQVLPLTNKNHWLLKWNLLNTYYTDTVREKKGQGFSCYHILVKNCREEYFNYYNCFISISKNTHFSYY